MAVSGRGTLGRRAVSGALAVALMSASPLGAQPAPGAAIVADAARDLAAVSAELERLEQEAQQLDAEAQGVAPRREALAQRARAQVRLLYHLVQGEALAVQGGPEALLAHVARVQHVRRAVAATVRELSQATERAGTVRVDRARTQALIAEARERRTALEAQRQQQEMLGGLRVPVSNAGLEPGAVGLPGVAVAAAATGGPAVTVYGGGVAATAPEAGDSFEQSIGRLLFPVAGRAEVRRAQRDGASGPAVEIVAPLGSPVRAVFPGRVAFADRYGPYGRIVILDHGDHYYTVSANLGSMNVRVGEEVATGTVLGTVGDDGRGPMLYFEVRHGSDNVDPAPWFGL